MIEPDSEDLAMSKELELAELQRQNKARQTQIEVPQGDKADDKIDVALGRLKQTLNGIKPVVDDEAEARMRESKIRQLQSFWNAPQRHLNRPIDYSVKEWADCLGRIEKRLGTGFLIALIGPRGPGKTQMAVELMRKATLRLKSARYCTAMDFFMDLKSCWRDSSRYSEEEVMEKYRKPSFLVVDESHERGETQWEDRILVNLIDSRYRDEKDTLLISNLVEQQFRESMGKSIYSRLVETGGVIECNWKSFRD